MNERIKWLIKPIYFEIQHLLMIIPDKAYLKIRYRLKVGRKLDLKNPVTYNEKLQWLKLYNRNPEYTKYADKYAVKKIVSNLIGEEYVIPTIGVWDRFNDIDFNSLPEKFVLKCTHDSGSAIVCNDKANFDFKNAKRKLDAEMRRNFYWLGREEQYKNIPRKIIAEPLIDGGLSGVRDYKFFVFNGEVKAMYVASDRIGGNTKFDFFDAEYNHLNFVNGHPNSTELPNKPKCFEKMKELSEILGKGFPHIRIDFYESENKVYFGEYTFYHMDGMARFIPEKWDYVFGEWLDISNVC